MDKFFEKYLALCKEKGINPSRVADALHISRASITGWRNGAEPRYDKIKALATFFDVPVSYFDETIPEGVQLRPEQITQEPVKNDFENEIINIYRGLSPKNKFELLTFVYNLKTRDDDENGRG